MMLLWLQSARCHSPARDCTFNDVGVEIMSPATPSGANLNRES